MWGNTVTETHNVQSGKGRAKQGNAVLSHNSRRKATAPTCVGGTSGHVGLLGDDGVGVHPGVGVGLLLVGDDGVELGGVELVTGACGGCGGACEHGVEHRGTSGPGVGRAAGSSPGLALDLAVDQAWTKTKTKPKTRP